MAEAKDLLRREFQRITENDKAYELECHQIFQCSAYFGAEAFTKASFRMPFLGIIHAMATDPPLPWNRTLCYTKDLFDFRLLKKLTADSGFDDDVERAYSLLEKFVEGQYSLNDKFAVDGSLNIKCSPSRNTAVPSNIDSSSERWREHDVGIRLEHLTTTIDDRDVHEGCLKQIYERKENASETDVAYVLAAHLFGPLSQNGCKLEKGCKGYPKNCPGGCGRIIEKGSTGIGGDTIWHGFADILVDCTIPVKILSDDHVTQELSDSEDSETYSLNVEVKKGLNILQKIESKSEVLAQTITNGFAQVNHHKCLENFFVPSFACSLEEISIFAYDSKNDFLACRHDGNLILVDPVNHCIPLFSLVYIWMYMNFALFMKPSDRLKIKKSNFHQIAPVQQYIDNAKCGVGGFRHRDSIPRHGFMQSVSAGKRKRSETSEESDDSESDQNSEELGDGQPAPGNEEVTVK